jgi:hypothetical protein
MPKKRKKLDLQGIEPWTTPIRASLEEKLMLREYYTTKPQARLLIGWLMERSMSTASICPEYIWEAEHLIYGGYRGFCVVWKILVGDVGLALQSAKTA